MSGRPIFLAILSAALFGAATPASKWLLSGLDPFQLAGLLYLGAALGVAPVAARGTALALVLPTDRRNRARLLGAVVFGGILGPIALLFGLRLADAASVSLWLNLELAATAVLGTWLFRDHLGRAGWLGVATALGAAALLSRGEGGTGAAAGSLVLLACLCWGLDNQLTALIDGITPSQSTLWKGAVAGSINLIIGMTLAPLPAAWPLVVGALSVGALSYGASIVLYIASAQSLGATRAQLVFASAPFFGVALAAVALGESISSSQGVAAALFAGVIGLLLLDRHSHWHAHGALEHAHSHRHDDGHHLHQHPGLPPSVRHMHRHRHEPLAHRHPHWPDLHHRHPHPRGDS